MHDRRGRRRELGRSKPKRTKNDVPRQSTYKTVPESIDICPPRRHKTQTGNPVGPATALESAAEERPDIDSRYNRE